MQLCFNELNAVGMALFFILKNDGEKIEHLKLMKLLYLAERTSLAENGTLISYDTPVAMEKGPVLENVKLIIGMKSHSASIWDKFLSRREGDYVYRNKKVNVQIDDINFISQSKIDTLEKVWSEHSSKSSDELVEYTHLHCKEWQSTAVGHKINIDTILIALGKLPSDIESIKNYLNDVAPISIIGQSC